MQRQARRGTPRRAEHSGVGYEGGVRPRLLQEREIFFRRGEIAAARIDIDGDVYLFPPRMGVRDPLFQLFVRKIIRKGAERKILPARIYRIGAEVQRRL